MKPTNIGQNLVIWACLVLAALALTGGGALPLAASEAPLEPGTEATDLFCPKCQSKLVKKTSSGVLHCTNPACNGAFFVDKKTGKVESLIATVDDAHAQKILDPTLQARVQKQLGEAQNKPDLNAVGERFYGTSRHLRVAGEGEEWHDPKLGPNGSTMPKVEYEETNCPVCGVKLKEPVEGHRNNQAGVDRDFMPHSLGTYAVASIVWLCPDCGYSALPEEFSKPVSAGFKASMLQETKPTMQRLMIDMVRNSGSDANKELPASELAFHEYVDINDIPDYIKYERALDVQEMQLKLDPNFASWDSAIQAKIYTEASWACREYLSGTIENGALVRVPLLQRSVQFVRAMIVQQPNQIDDLNAQYENARVLLDDMANGDARQPGRPHYEEYAFLQFYVMLNKAGLEDRLGHAQDAWKSLQAAQEAVPSPALFISAEEKMLLVPVLKQFQKEADLRIRLLKSEQEYMRRAALNAIVALYLGRYPRKDLAPQVYLIAEQMRRVGAFRRSLAWFQLSAKLNGEEGPLAAWTREQMGLLTSQKLTPDAQDQKLFDHLLKAYADVNAQKIPPCMDRPKEFTLVPDAVVEKTDPTATAHPGTATAGVHTVPESLSMFYKALDAHRKLTGNLPGLPEEMVQKGTWKKADCKELQFQGKKVLYGETKLGFVYDPGGTTGWGSKSCFLLMPAQDNEKAMYVLCGDGEIIDLNAPAKK